MVVLGLFAFGLGLTLTTRATAVARLGYEIADLERQIQGLERESERLRLEGAQLGSVARVEEQAASRLSMAQPQEVRLVMAPAADTVTVAEGGTVTFLAGPVTPGTVYAAAPGGWDAQGAATAGAGGAALAAADGNGAAEDGQGPAKRGGALVLLAQRLLHWLSLAAPAEAGTQP